jgi:dsDNA-specific endonuclease/ATPase MutS2
MLRTMGASKQLYDFRRNLLNSTKQQGNLSMPEKTIQELEGEIKSLNTKLEDANSKIKTLGADGSKQIMEIPKEVEEKLSKFDTIEKENIENKKALEAIKKEREDEKAKIAQAKREEMATIIANGEIITKEYPEDKINERKKFWTELKGEDGQLKDISLLAEKFQKMTPKTIGSSGLRLEDIFPQMGGSDSQSSTFDIMEEIS